MPQQLAASTRVPASLRSPGVRQLYLALSERTIAPGVANAAAHWLRGRLDRVGSGPPALPGSADLFGAWWAGHSAAVGEQYQQYLAARKHGVARRYFANKAHALYFLKCVAPAKLVDGACLYGLLKYWRQGAMRPLITTYLEELGNGVPEKNHVAIYQQLIDAHGCAQWQGLSEQHFVAGLVALAMAHNADQFLPELIGYHLGHEQLPLHLLITSYELHELGIDAHYFTLHVTLDNAHSGHARKACQALPALMPHVADAAAFLRRVDAGYRLNASTDATASVIAAFDLHAELVGILRAKGATGKHMHTDACKVGGRTLRDWLSDPDHVPALLAALEADGWFRRGAAPETSRFWRLIQSNHAQMFGVFSAYEQQVLHDWIANAPWAAHRAPPRLASDGAGQRASDRLIGQPPRRVRDNAERGVIRHLFTDDEHAWETIGCELRLLEAKLAASDSKEEAIALLTALMSPANHHSAAGLMATRIFCQLYA